MSANIDPSIYFWSLVFSTGILGVAYRLFKVHHDDYRDNIISDLKMVIKRQADDIEILEKEAAIRTMVNDPVLITMLRKEFDESKTLFKTEVTNNTNENEE